MKLIKSWPSVNYKPFFAVSVSATKGSLVWLLHSASILWWLAGWRRFAKGFAEREPEQNIIAAAGAKERERALSLAGREFFVHESVRIIHKCKNRSCFTYQRALLKPDWTRVICSIVWARRKIRLKEKHGRDPFAAISTQRENFKSFRRLQAHTFSLWRAVLSPAA